MKQQKSLFITLAAILFLPYVFYGFQYFPVLDDYIQYWAYPAYHNLSYVYHFIGTMATRPLASLLDPVFWGQFWPCLSLALLLITLLLFASFLFLHKTIGQYKLNTSPFFALIFLLSPLGMEGRFWLSAATRLVPGLFFASLSLYYLSRFLEGDKKIRHFILFASFQFIACGFYEAVTVFAAAAAMLMFCISFYRQRKKIFFLVPAVSILNVGAMFFYYRFFANLGALGSRANPTSLALLPEKIASLFAQLGQVASFTFARTFIGSFKGVVLLCQNGLWGVFLLGAMCVAAFFLCRFQKGKGTFSLPQVLCIEIVGLILFFAPLLPNLLSKEVWLTNRSLFVSLIGLALVTEPLFSLGTKRLRRLLLFIMAFLFMTASVNEYDVYKRVHQQDVLLVDRVIEQMSPAAKDGNQPVLVVLTKPITTEQNAYYKDHVKSVFDSDWALTGAVRARMKSLKPKNIQPVLEGALPAVPNAQIITLTHP